MFETSITKHSEEIERYEIHRHEPLLHCHKSLLHRHEPITSS